MGCAEIQVMSLESVKCLLTRVPSQVCVVSGGVWYLVGWYAKAPPQFDWNKNQLGTPGTEQRREFQFTGALSQRA